MIEGNLAVWLNMLAIASITFVISNFAVSAVVSLMAQRFLQIEVNSRKAILWLLVATPWLSVFCIAVCFAYQFNQYQSLITSNTYTHWHHISSFGLLSWHSISLLAAAIVLCWILSRKLHSLYQHNKQLSLLRSLSDKIADDVFEIESDEPSAFTGGLFRNYCFITSGMLRETTLQEQQVILGHERAHARRKDPLKKWLFSLLTSFFLPSISNRLKLHMTLAMEQTADMAVIKEDISATFVASTLVKVARLNQQAGGIPIIDSELVANFGADVLEQRVHFLLGQLSLKPANKFIVSLFLVLTFVVCLSSLDSIHHFVETVFSH